MLFAIGAGPLPAALICLLLVCHGATLAASPPTQPDAEVATRQTVGPADAGPALLAWSQSCLGRLQNAYKRARAFDDKAAKPTLLTATDERYKNYSELRKFPGQEAGIAWDSNGKEYDRLIAEIEIRDRDDLYENVPNNWIAVHDPSGAISESDPKSPRQYFDENANTHPLIGSGPVKKGYYNAYRRTNHAVAHIHIIGLINPKLAASLVDIFEPVLDTCLREGQALNIIPPSSDPSDPPHTPLIWREPPLEITLSADGLPHDARLHIEILSNRTILNYRPDFNSEVDSKKQPNIDNKPTPRIIYRGPKWTCDIAWPFSDKHPCLTPKRWLSFPVPYLHEERKPINECQLRAVLTSKNLRKTVIHNFYIERHEQKIDISLNLEEAEGYIPVRINRWISPPKSISIAPVTQWPINNGPVYRLTNKSHQTVYTINTGTLELWQDARWQPAYVRTKFQHPMDLSQQVRPMDWAHYSPILLDNRPQPLPPGKYRYRLRCYLMPWRMELVDTFELISEFSIPPLAPPGGSGSPADAGAR